MEIRPIKGQVDDLLGEIRKRVERNQRVLVTTLTKRMAEDLAEYYSEVGVRCRYLHSEVSTLDRVKILRDLRRGEFDVLIGINLLREGLDLPEVSLVAILDADKEGFLRSAGALIQTMGRAARHLEGQRDPLRRRDDRQHAPRASTRPRAGAARSRSTTRRNDITPQSIIKPIDMSLVAIAEGGLRDGAARSRTTKCDDLHAGAAHPVHRGTGGAHARGRAQVRIREGGAVARPGEGAAGEQRGGRLMQFGLFGSGAVSASFVARSAGAGHERWGRWRRRRTGWPAAL